MNTLTRSYKAENAHVFENALRLSLTKLEKYRRIPNGNMHDIVCTTNLSNRICSVLDAIIMQENPDYIPKKPLPPPIPMVVEDIRFVKRKQNQLVRKRSSLSEMDVIFVYIGVKNQCRK
jgi:hypothetical protein